ncbi:RNA-binding protein 5, partial [Tetrabaena socialis]
NIPEDREDFELRQVLEGFPGLLSVKLVRTRGTGQSRGHAFVEFATEADAAVLMETKARYSLQLGGQTLRLEYAANATLFASAVNSLDWVCEMCSVVNFARRTECHKCSTARPSNPQRISAEADAPSPILKVSNLEPHISDDDLRAAFLAHVSVKDVRVVLDKYTGLPRGLAFVEMFSVGEATRALGLLQGAVPAGCAQPLRLCYARDKFGGVGGPMGGAAGGVDGADAAQAMYSGWEPKAFDAKALDGEAAGQDGAGGSRPRGGAQGQEAAGTSKAGPSAASSSAAQGQTPAGFVFDAASGYWYDAASGYYYDSATGLYYHRTTNTWYSYDRATGVYAAAGAQQATATAAAEDCAPLQDSAEAAAAAAAATPVATEGAAAPQAQPAVVAAKAPAVAAAKRTAVIGAAPVLNVQGLLAAAALAEEKNKKAQKVVQQQAKQAARAGQAAIGPQPQPQAKAPAGPAPVQGVIHRGKWAQRPQ